MRITVGELRKLIHESVIDATSKFAKKRKQDLSTKLADVVTKLPNFFADQEISEHELNDRMNQIRSQFDKAIGPRRLYLAARKSFEADAADYGEIDPQHVSPWQEFSLVSPRVDPQKYVELKLFVLNNRGQVLQALQNVEEQVAELMSIADADKRITQWKRYTQWGSFSSELSRLKNIIHDMSKV